MTKISNDIIAGASRAYAAAGIDQAGLLTVVEVETGGRPFEPADLDPSDGIEPALLFERHVFLKQLKALAPDQVAEARRQGLVVDRWQGPGSAQYADQGTSAGRLALVAKAAALNAEAAYRSCSLGLFQVMGFNHAACGYDSAVDMHEALTKGGIEAHFAAGIAFMRSKGLLAKLASRDWKAFASGYNGTAYARNKYDRKLAEAYARWVTALRAAPAPAAATADVSTLQLGSKGPRVYALQESLATFGIPALIDGKYGPATRRAVASAQVELGLVGDGVATADFVAKLEAAPALPGGRREVAGKDEVKQASFAARAGDNLRKAGGAGLGLVTVYQGYAASVQSGVDQLKATRDSLTGLVGDGVQATAAAWFVDHWQALALAGGCATAVVLGGSLLGSAIHAYRSGRLVA